MTWTVGPFDGAAWSEASWFDHMPAAMRSGVIGTKPANATTGELSFSSSGLNITLGTGRANVGGGGAKNTAPLGSVTVPSNGNTTLARRDRVVLRRDLGTHTITPVVIQGTPSGSPTAPNIVRNTTTFDLKLFSFVVPANNGTTLSGVVDERVWIDDGSATPTGEGANALLHGTSTQNIATGGTLKVVTLDTKVRAVGMTTDTAAGKITADVTGVYLVSGGVSFAANTNGRRVVGILLNDTLVDQTQNAGDPDSANSTPLATATYPVLMAAGEYVQLGAFHSAGVSLTVDRSRSFLQAHWIGAAT